MTEVKTTPFDNEISILYKWARHFGIPIKLIIISTEIRGEKEETVYSNGVERVEALIQSGLTLNKIYDELKDKMELEDIVMIYASSPTVSRSVPVSSVVDEINRLYDDLGIRDMIRDEMELRLLVADWRNNIRFELQDNLEDLVNLEIIHDELAKYPEVSVSPIKVDSVTIKASPTLKDTDQPPKPDDGYDMFNQSIPSYHVPFIRYNSQPNGKREEFFKLYKGKTGEKTPNYKIIVPPGSQTNSNNNFYMTVWSGKGDLSKATKESYMKAEYDIESNILTVKTPIEEGITRRTIVSKIENSLPINIVNVTETRIGGEFFLFDLDIDDIYLVDMIINIELMSTYLFVKETNTPYAEKKQLKIYYKSFTGFVEEEEKVTEGYIVNPSSVSISLTQNYAQGGEIVTVQTSEGPVKHSLTYNLPYVRAKITQAESREVAGQFVKIFSRLMQFYKSERANTKRLFLTFIPELDESLVSTKSVKITTKQPVGRRAVDSKIERLKDAAPDLFVNGYARKCQCVFQPIEIPSDEIEAWQNKTFLYKNVMKKRQVMSFPPNNPRWKFVCPDDSFPFPGVKFNKDLSNKDIYPCVPCCFKDDQMDPKARSNYNECFRGKTKEEVKLPAKETHKIKTDKILSPGRYGFLPKSIADLLSKYSEKSIDMVRMGVIHSVNSILHSVSIAIGDPSYLELKTVEEKESYVSGIRNIISNQSLPNLLRQEMYDFTNEEIMEELSDPNNFLDPNLFYRAIEESYNINIYVFSPEKKNDSQGSLEMPRFKLFHSRSPRPNRVAVVLFRTWGAESDALEYPQCELIVDRDEDNNKNITNFGVDMNSLLQSTLMTINRTITWELTEGKSQILARDNIYSRANYYDLLGKLPDKQIIDGYGKTRALIFPVGEIEITVIIPSSQPENLPTGEITRVDVNIVVAVFGEPRAVTRSGNLVDGLWYKVLDLEYGIYVPINRTEQYLDKQIGPNNPLVEKGVEVVQRIRKIKRDLETIIQIIIWLYILSGMDFRSFVLQYMSIGRDPVEDSANVYDLSKINRKFPLANTVDEGVAQMKLLAPSLFRLQDRIYLYSQKFFDGLFYHLEKYDKERKPRDPKTPTVIYRSDISEEDFTPQRHVAIFTNENDMRTWLNSLEKLSFKNIIIEDQLNISNALRTEPYLYTAPTGNIFLIQNVIGGSRPRSLNVAYKWYLRKINLGHGAAEFDTETQGQIPVNVVYGISTALGPIVVENNAGDATRYLQILTYGSDQHAAMLPLL